MVYTEIPDYIRPTAAVKRILITGGSSYVGQHLVPLAIAAGYDVRYTYFSHDPIGMDEKGEQLDLRDGAAVDNCFASFRPDGVIHLAGSNRSPDMTALIEEGTAFIAQAAKHHQCRLIHMSTDVIFDGTAAPYREDDHPTPLHDYGRAKANAEKVVADSHQDYAIIRPSLIYGLDKIDRGTEWMIKSLGNGEPVTLFTNQIRTPIWVETLNSACLELLHHDFCGILHVGGTQILSRADFGIRLLDWWQVEERGTLSLAPTPENAPWPPDTTLDSTKVQTLLQTPIVGVDQVLHQSH